VIKLGICHPRKKERKKKKINERLKKRKSTESKENPCEPASFDFCFK